MADKVMRSAAGSVSESVYVLLLNTRNRLIGIHEVSMGGVARTVLEPIQLFQAAMIANASAMIMVHNHPSGNPEPSSEDISLAHSMKDMAGKLGVRMLDFMIIGQGAYVSFADRGII